MRKKWKNPVEIGCKEFYEKYNSKYKKAFTREEFFKIMKLANKRMAEAMVFDNVSFVLPCRMGSLGVVKSKLNLRVVDNEIATRSLKVDWHATKQLWAENEDCRLKKQLIYHLNTHTSGFFIRFKWDKRTCNAVNNTFYVFKPSRVNQRNIARAVNEGCDWFEYK